jgi:hypothetical protein
LVTAARERLGKHFKQSEYPAVDQIRSAFSVNVRYMTFNVPAALKELNTKLFERERQKIEKQWAQAADEIQNALRVAFSGLVDHMVDRLGYEDNGKPKTFRDTLVDKMEDFFHTFEARNLTNDGQLKALVDKARRVMRGVSANDLRNLDTVRSSVSKRFEELKSEVDKNIVVKSTRKFGFKTQSAE